VKLRKEGRADAFFTGQIVACASGADEVGINVFKLPTSSRTRHS
jgi:hypothetical protein